MTTTRAVALSVGALLGPSLLLVPGLAAAIAGPASIVAWVGLLLLSGLFAWVFTALGRRVGAAGGLAAYAAAGLGPMAGRVVTGWFLVGVVLGAPVVSLVGGEYVAAATGGGRPVSIAVAAALLLIVLVVTMRGAGSSTTAQLTLVVVLVTLVAVGVIGSVGALDARNWTPFTPRGLGSIGDAAAVLMLSFVGWEAVVPVLGGLPDAARQLPRVVIATLAITATVYLSVAVATIGALGNDAGGTAPLAALLQIAVGPAGPLIAAAAAVALTLAGTNAYLTGAVELVREARGGDDARPVQMAVATVGATVLAVVAAGWVSVESLVAFPTALFLAVYAGCTASGARSLRGAVRAAATLACAATVVVLAFTGPSVLAVLLVAAGVLVGSRSRAVAARFRSPHPTLRG